MKNELNVFYLLFMAILHFFKWLFRPIYRFVKYKPLTKFWKFYKKTLAFVMPEFAKSYIGRIVMLPFWLFMFVVIVIGGVLTMSYIVMILKKIKAQREIDSKYKKVIKEGLFWDSVEYHEREQK